MPQAFVQNEEDGLHQDASNRKSDTDRNVCSEQKRNPERDPNESVSQLIALATERRTLLGSFIDDPPAGM